MEKQKNPRLVFLSLLRAFKGLEVVNVNISELEKKERRRFKRSGRSVRGNFSSFLGMSGLPAIAKLSCLFPSAQCSAAHMSCWG